MAGLGSLVRLPLRTVLATFLVIGGGITSAGAADLFALEGTVSTLANGQTTTTAGSASSNNILDFIDYFQSNQLRSIFANYTDSSAATVTANIRGIGATLSYGLNSPALRLQVPRIGLDQTFNGLTRDESQDQLKRWFQGDGASMVNRLLQLGVSSTPVDPVAGNPNSLMAIMTSQDFGQASGFGSRAGTVGLGSRNGGQFEVGLRYGSFSVGAYDQQTYALPLSYRYGFANGDALLIDAPITFSQTNNSANTYSGTFGIGYAWKVPEIHPDVEWTLTPAARFGAVGSVDLGGAAGMWSVSGTSTVAVHLDRLNPGLTATVSNMVGHLQTIPLKVGDYDLSYNLTNQSFRNGVMVTQRVGEVFGRPLDVSAYVVDTRFAGSKLYVDAFQEYGLFASLGTANFGMFSLPMRVGVNYLRGKHEFEGFGITAGFSF